MEEMVTNLFGLLLDSGKLSWGSTENWNPSILSGEE